MSIIKKYALFESAEDQREGDFVAFHGSLHAVEKFTDEFVGKGHDQEGPGIYFTSSENDARLYYGPYITQVRLHLKKTVPTQGAAIREEVMYLINAAPDLEQSLEHFGEETKNANFLLAVDTMMHGQTAHNTFQNVWFDFYKKQPQEFVRNLVKLGYDGVVIKKKKDVKHFVVYNPNAIEVIKINN